MHQEGIHIPLIKRRKRFSLTSPVSVELLQELHYEATHPARKPKPKGEWHNVEGYPTIRSVSEGGPEVWAMDREGNLYRGDELRKVSAKHAGNKPKKQRPIKLKRELAPEHSRYFLEEPRYIPPLGEVKGEYADEIEKQMREKHIQRQELPQELLAKLTPAEVHKRALSLEKYRLLEHGIRQSPEELMQHAARDALSEVSTDFIHRNIRPPGVLPEGIKKKYGLK
jgi:hypothetical protein